MQYSTQILQPNYNKELVIKQIRSQSLSKREWAFQTITWPEQTAEFHFDYSYGKKFLLGKSGEKDVFSISAKARRQVILSCYGLAKNYVAFTLQLDEEHALERLDSTIC
jgi:hypothetical protein